MKTINNVCCFILAGIIALTIFGCREASSSKANFYLKKGKTFYNKGEYDSAIKDFTEAIRLKPDDADYYIRRGDAYRDKNEYDSAIKDLTEAIRLKPDDADYYIWRGVGWSEAGIRENLRW